MVEVADSPTGGGVLPTPPEHLHHRSSAAIETTGQTIETTTRNALNERRQKRKVQPTTNAQAEATIEKMIISTRNPELVVDMFSKKTGIDEKTAETAVKKVRKRILKRASVDFKAEIGLHLTALDVLFQNATQAKDTKTALAVEKERGKTLSLYNKIEEEERAKQDKEKDAARAILQSAIDAPIERLDDLARAVVNRLIELETNR